MYVADVIEIKGTINVMSLNYPKPFPFTPDPWKMSSMKLAPGAKEVGDHWPKAFLFKVWPVDWQQVLGACWK